MKRFGIVALALALVLSAAWPQGQVSVNYWRQAFLRVTESAAAAAKLGNYGYQRGISILGAWVDSKDQCSFSIYLEKDVNYMFVAAGDNDAQDVDFEILDAAGKTLASEDRNAPDATVMFTPAEGEYYTMKLTLAKSRANLHCLCVVCVLREDGLKVPLKNLDDCADKMMSLFSDADRFLQKKGNMRLELRKARNQWGVYGAVLEPGKDISVTNLDLGGIRRFVLAVGDNNSEDVDLFLMDDKRNVIAKDDKTSATAAIVFAPRAQDRYGVKMLNYKGNGPSVIMTGFFDALQR
jgi:hypothetical protein